MVNFTKKYNVTPSAVTLIVIVVFVLFFILALLTMLVRDYDGLVVMVVILMIDACQVYFNLNWFLFYRIYNDRLYNSRLCC